MEGKEDKPRLKGQPVWLTTELYTKLKDVKAAKGGTLAWHACMDS